MPRWRAGRACLLGALLLTGSRAHTGLAGQQALPPPYIDALADYRQGKIADAVRTISAFPAHRVDDLADALRQRRSEPGGLRDLTTAILLHTEIWLAGTSAGSMDFRSPHLAVARVLARSVLRLAEEGQAAAADRLLVRDWYLLVASYCHGNAAVAWSRVHTAEARRLFPDDPAVLLLTGTEHEILSQQATGSLDRYTLDGAIEGRIEIDADNELKTAERLLAQAAKAAPDLVEAHLRLGRVLHRRGDLEGAVRELEAARQLAHHDVVRYLASVFLGLAETRRARYARASELFDEALRIHPGGQAVAIGLSQLAYLTGRGIEAGAIVGKMLEKTGAEDPWWFYQLGDWWHFEARVAAIRARVRQ